MGDGGADGGWRRRLRLRLAEVDDHSCSRFIVFVFVVCSSRQGKRDGEGQYADNDEDRSSTLHFAAPLKGPLGDLACEIRPGSVLSWFQEAAPSNLTRNEEWTNDPR